MIVEVCIIISHKKINNMKKKTYYHLILDKSGSMLDCIDSTISGFNEQIQAIKSLHTRFPNQTIEVGLTTFNHEVSHHCLCKSVQSIEQLTVKNYTPDGSTALLDAIGITTSLIKEELQHDLKDKNNTIVVVVITDGYENASKVFNLERIRKMINELEHTEQWTFSFLGSTIDAVDVAEKMSFKRSNSMFFDKQEMKETVFRNVTDSLSNYFYNKERNIKTNNFLNKEP